MRNDDTVANLRETEKSVRSKKFDRIESIIFLKNLGAQGRQSQSFLQFFSSQFLNKFALQTQFLVSKREYRTMSFTISWSGIEAFGRRRCFNPNPHTTCRPPLMTLKQTCLVVIHLTRDKHGGRVASGHNRRDLLQAAAS